MTDKTKSKLIELLYNPGSLNTVFDERAAGAATTRTDTMDLPPSLAAAWQTLEIGAARPEIMLENLIRLRSILSAHAATAAILPRFVKVISRLAAHYPHSTEIFSQALGLVSDYKQRADSRPGSKLHANEWVELERCLHTLCQWEEQLDRFLELTH